MESKTSSFTLMKIFNLKIQRVDRVSCVNTFFKHFLRKRGRKVVVLYPYKLSLFSLLSRLLLTVFCESASFRLVMV